MADAVDLSQDLSKGMRSKERGADDKLERYMSRKLERGNGSWRMDMDLASFPAFGAWAPFLGPGALSILHGSNHTALPCLCLGHLARRESSHKRTSITIGIHHNPSTVHNARAPLKYSRAHTHAHTLVFRCQQYSANTHILISSHGDGQARQVPLRQRPGQTRTLGLFVVVCVHRDYKQRCHICYCTVVLGFPGKPSCDDNFPSHPVLNSIVLQYLNHEQEAGQGDTALVSSHKQLPYT